MTDARDDMREQSSHVPFLFLILVVFLVLRFAGLSRRRRYYPPRGGWV